MKAQIGFTSATGADPRRVLIEGKDQYRHRTNSLYGGSNSRAGDAGTLYRIGPPLQ
jgi:hypothetical protein